MNVLPKHLTSLALLVIATQMPSHAESFASSASSAGSASSGSVSDSLQGSSNSSKGDNKVADGEYRVIDIAEAPGRPGMLRLKLQAQATPREASQAGEWQLTLPAAAVAARPLAVGDVVAARNRPYGVEFAYAAPATSTTPEPFFLVLADEWQRELAPRRVAL